MTRIHALVIAVAVSFAVAAGAFAAFRTTRLGESAGSSIDAVAVAAQTRKLDESEASLRRSLRARPPRLPRVPKLKHPAVPTGTPPPVVRVVHLPRPAATVAATTTVSSTTTSSATTTAATPRVVTTTPTTTTKSSPHTGEHETSTDDAHEHTTSTADGGPDD